MTDGVTYADLQFNDISMKETGYGGSSLEEFIEDVTYENVTAAQQEKRPTPVSNTPVSGVHQLKAGLQKWSLHLSLVLLLLCLLLSAAVIGLTMKYVQMSSDLQEAEANHQTMTQSLKMEGDLLGSVRRELMATQTKLEKTSMKLEEAVKRNADLNSSLLQCQWQEQKSTADRQGAEGSLKDSRSKLEKYERDACPDGWVLLGMKCLWMSDYGNTWQNSEKDCESKDSKLVVVQQDDTAMKDFLARKGDFWVGKEITWTKSWTHNWKWPSRYQS
ncbi:B-cell differentiation antigen CD72-like [Pyxicephalus adspersus]|uniref:B-cell differentiation antigen CD72-like n=1 Tax=Pyxicephalus adspersus TaxID=30357 RepID=UPI003B5B1B49